MTDPRQYLPLSPQQFHILLALADRERHGYGIILDVAARTSGELRMGTGTLYTAVARLEALALIADAGRREARRQFYRLTPLGRRVLSAETARLESLVRHAHAQGVRGKSPARS
jgi:DNA-binding PadR family transcriptional regulator